MKLLTKEIIKSLPALYSTEEMKDPVLQVKIFHPFSSYTFFILEYDPEKNLAFGYVTGLVEDELGYVDMKELEEVKIMGVRMERDLYYTPQKLSEIKKTNS